MTVATLRLKHNPSHMSDDELIRSFVVRQRDLAAILETVRDNTGSSNQHLLILGPRGMGKTTLVNRAVSEVRRDVELSRLWYPILFDEESYTVTSAGELWFQALSHLADQTQSRALDQARKALQHVTDRERLRDASLARLLEFADAQQRRLLLVFENIDMIFDEQMDDSDAWDVRHTLQNEPRIMALATSTTRLDSFHDSNKPLYELFREHTLDRLDLEECRTVWHLVTDTNLPLNQARPIQIFTGGNTRLLTILATFAKDRSFRELMDDLVGLIDENTPYFKHNVEALPKESRKVFVTLADLWSPATSRQVADQTRGDIRAVSTQLGRLERQGIIEVARRVDKTMMYQVSERMYNLYYLLRRRGSPRVRAVVEFIVRYYDHDGMQRLLTSMATEACDLDSARREDHVRAYCELMRRLPDQQQRHAVLDHAPAQFLEIPDISRLLQELASGPDEALALEEPDLRDRLAQTPGDPRLLRRLAQVLTDRGELHRAMELLDEALKIDATSRDAAALMAHLLIHHPDMSPAMRVEAFARLADRTRESAHEFASSMVAFALGSAGLHEEARQTANEVLERWPNSPVVAFIVGSVFGALGDRRAAGDAFIHTLELEPANVEALLALYNLLIEDGDFPEAEARLRGGLALRPRASKVWQTLIDFLRVAKADPQSALRESRRAVALNPDDSELAYRLGALLSSHACWNEAEQVFRRMLADPRSDRALPGFVLSLLAQNKTEEARGVVLPRLVAEASVASHVAAAMLFGADEHTRDISLEHLRKAVALAPGDMEFYGFAVGMYRSFGDGDGVRTTTLQLIRHHDRRPDVLETVCRFALGTATAMLYPDVMAWARELATAQGTTSSGALFLAQVLARTDAWEDVWEPLEAVMAQPALMRIFLRDVVEILSRAAARGHAVHAARLLAASCAAVHLEPLAVALARITDAPTNPPQEVSEVADDIVRDIERLRRALTGTPNGVLSAAPTQDHRHHRRAMRRSRSRKYA